MGGGGGVARNTRCSQLSFEVESLAKPCSFWGMDKANIRKKKSTCQLTDVTGFGFRMPQRSFYISSNQLNLNYKKNLYVILEHFETLTKKILAKGKDFKVQGQGRGPVSVYHFAVTPGKRKRRPLGKCTRGLPYEARGSETFTRGHLRRKHVGSADNLVRRTDNCSQTNSKSSLE